MKFIASFKTENDECTRCSTSVTADAEAAAIAVDADAAAVGAAKSSMCFSAISR